MNRVVLFAVAAAVGLSACSDKQAPPPPAPGGAAAAGTSSGKVVQAQNAGGYTYAEVEVSTGGKVWIAGAAIPIKAGDTVQWGPYAVMQNFTAKSLNRTFEQILFVNSWAPAGGAVAQVSPHGTFPTGQPAAAPGPAPLLSVQAPAAPAAAGPASNQGQVKSVTNSGGYSYLEVAQGAGSVWVAVVETPVKVGDQVRWDGGATMHNFTAKSLNRTFDQIVFAGGVSVIR